MCVLRSDGVVASLLIIGVLFVSGELHTRVFELGIGVQPGWEPPSGYASHLSLSTQMDMKPPVCCLDSSWASVQQSVRLRVGVSEEHTPALEVAM